MIPLGTIGSEVTDRSQARYSQVFVASSPGEVSKWANFAPAGSRKPILGEVWLTPIGVLTSGTIALHAGGLGPGDDAGQRVAVVPVVELEPERQRRLGGGDVLDAGRRVDRDGEQAAGPRGAVGHRQLAVGMDRLLEADRPDHDRRRHRRAEQRRLGPDARDVDEDARAQPAAPEGGLVVTGEIGPGPGADPLVGRRVEHVPGDLAEDPRIESVDQRIGHRGSRQRRIGTLA